MARQKEERARKEAEAEAQNLAAWQFLGGSTEQMWLLTDKQLSLQCAERGLPMVVCNPDLTVTLPSGEARTMAGR